MSPRRFLDLSVLALLCCLGGAVRAEPSLHSLWELHGKHNTVYLLGSVHVLRASDYPLPPVIEDAYRAARTLTLEIDLDAADASDLPARMLSSAQLPEGHTLTQVLGMARYDKAERLARALGFDLAPFDAFAPWFAAEAISQAQLTQLGFDAQSGIDLYFLAHARGDGKAVDGLESVQEQLAVFASWPLETQAAYLLASLEEASELPREVDGLVTAWRRGDTAWFERELTREFGKDPEIYQSLLVARNRRWISRIEALLRDDETHLVIVGTAHLVGKDGLLALLGKDGFNAVQR